MAAVLHTQRCSLHPWTLHDAPEVGALLREPSVRRFLLDDQLVDNHWVQSRITDSQVRFTHGGFGVWSVRQDDAMLGFAGFLPAGERPVLELVYALHPDRVGQGYATEAARAVVNAYLATGNLPVHASIDEPNTASEAVLTRLGFRRTSRSEPTDDGFARIHFELDPR